MIQKKNIQDRRILISGDVAGVRACELLIDNDTITAGSAITCDLVVQDPLAPAKAFTLSRIKHHHNKCDCNVVLMLKAYRGARVFVNDSLTDRSMIAIGDTLALGCHRFVVGRADEADRNRRLNVQVSDLCSKLLRDSRIPSGFLASSSSMRHRKRIMQASKSAALFVLLAAILFMLIPSQETMEVIQEPLLVTMVSEQLRLPDDAVRSLEDVERKKHDETIREQKETFEKKVDVQFNGLDAQPLKTTADMPAPEKPEDLMERRNTMASLAPLGVDIPDRPAPTISREANTLGRSAPLRRLSRDEVADTPLSTHIGNVVVKPDAGSPPMIKPTASRSALTETIAGLPKTDLNWDRAKGVDRIRDYYKASPLEFEKYKDITVPVARISEELKALDEPAKAASIKADGVITDDEKEISWKSGQLRTHMSANPPPIADPPTFCYVSRAENNGKPCFYISFVCQDPDLNRLVTSDALSVNRQDSIEIYLDTNFDRHDYYHMLVGANGKVVTKIQADARNIAKWNAGATIKTAVNRDAKQWTCEVMIPFNTLGGVPKKGQRWAVNFCRNFRGQSGKPYDTRGVQSWFSVYRKKPSSLHNADLFGVFQW